MPEFSKSMTGCKIRKSILHTCFRHKRFPILCCVWLIGCLTVGIWPAVQLPADWSSVIISASWVDRVSAHLRALISCVSLSLPLAMSIATFPPPSRMRQAIQFAHLPSGPHRCPVRCQQCSHLHRQPTTCLSGDHCQILLEVVLGVQCCNARRGEVRSVPELSVPYGPDLSAPAAVY